MVAISIPLRMSPAGTMPRSRGLRCPSWMQHALVERESAGNAGRWPQPMSLKKSARLQKKMQAAVTTGPAEHPAFPARWLTFYTCSPQGPAVLPLFATTLARCAGLSTGRPGPHDFTSASCRSSAKRQLRCSTPHPSHSIANVRDDRPKRPSSSQRDARKYPGDLSDDTRPHACDKLARRALEHHADEPCVTREKKDR